MTTVRRLISIAHSYVVALNRRLGHEMAIAGRGKWEIAMVSPSYYAGRNDLRPIPFEPLQDEPCCTVPVNAYLTGHTHVFFYGRQLRTLLGEPWDLVHCWQEPYILAGAQICWLTPRHIPLVFYTMQNNAKRYPPPFCCAERYCIRRCAGWLAVGQTTVDTQLTRGYGQKPYCLTPLGVALDHFRPDAAARRQTRRKLSWEESGPPVVGYLGRFVPEKGLRLLMRVLETLQTPWRALFVGAGPLEEELRLWASAQGPRARVITGVVHDHVPQYLNAMDLLCAPSQTLPRWREQQGRMLIEAWACGVPVVGSDSGEIPHVIADSGVIVGEKDEAGWRRALADLLESPARRAVLAEQGLERVQEVYAWPVIARRHLAFFDELLERKSANSTKEIECPALP